METLKLHYGTNSSELCELGKKYDTDKSSQRSNVTCYRHCHAYTLLYDSLFRHLKHADLNIAELGILEGGSLLMWKDYFTRARLYGFDNSVDYIDRFRQRYDMDRITLGTMNVNDAANVASSFAQTGVMYDIIIEDTTHQFEDQIRVIEQAHAYLKPGGIMIIEDIFKRYNEQDYARRLEPLMEHFQEMYFVEVDHARRYSGDWDNDKLLILVKAGADSIVAHTHRLTIITPSYRTENLTRMKESINFDYVDEWIIVYDGTKISEHPHLFDNPKIKEYVHTGEGISGNPQRNYALTQVTHPDTLLYYLDDDNVIHPNLYHLMKVVDTRKMYTFNVEQRNRLKGNNVRIGEIDTAMMVLPHALCRDTQWTPERYDADGIYITELYSKHKDAHVFVDNTLCYYNMLRP